MDQKLMEALCNRRYEFCEDVSKYQKLAKIGQGTFGEVFKARNRKNCKDVALKKIFMHNEMEGFPITALREINILKNIHHKNLVNLIEVCSTRDTKPISGKINARTFINTKWSTFYLVFDFCEHDLDGLLRNKTVEFQLGHIKMVLKQLLEGLFYLHCCKVLHRDIKPSNILITKFGELKIADFGLARAYSVRQNCYTNRVVTLWYRPPELLLGETNYGPSVDLWGVGCVMAEMWTRTPIMQGSSEQNQLILITQLCGNISPETYKGKEGIKFYNNLAPSKNMKRKVKDRLQPYVKHPSALDLIDKLLTLESTERISCEKSLDHKFFWEDPIPTQLYGVLSKQKQSQFQFLMNMHGKNEQKTAHKPKHYENDHYEDKVF